MAYLTEFQRELLKRVFDIVDDGDLANNLGCTEEELQSIRDMLEKTTISG